MKTQRKIQILILAFGLSTFTSALADEVRMKNGDRITGKIVRMEKEKLALKTDYAGEITLAWSEVASLSVEEPIKVLMKDGTTLQGRTMIKEQGKMMMRTTPWEEPLVLDLPDVMALNPSPKRPVRITARANAGLILERGNTNADTGRIDASFSVRTEKSRYAVAGELNREKSDGQDTVNNWSAYANYDYFFVPKWFWYARTQFEHDEFADLDLRSTLSSGLGYQVFEGEILNLSFAAGPSYVDENFIKAQDDNFSAAQWVINYDQYFFDKFIQVFHNQTGYLRFSDSKNWVIKTRQGLRFPLQKGLTFTLQYNYDYTNQPSPDARERYDSKFMVLVGYTL
jgi:putative salt-induced outer membrane protein YdiY